MLPEAPGAVFDDERLPERLLQLGREVARDDVRGTARRVRDQHLDGSIRIRARRTARRPAAASTPRRRRVQVAAVAPNASKDRIRRLAASRSMISSSFASRGGSGAAALMACSAVLRCFRTMITPGSSGVPMPIGNSSHTNPASECVRLVHAGNASRGDCARRAGSVPSAQPRTIHRPMECNQPQRRTSR